MRDITLRYVRWRDHWAPGARSAPILWNGLRRACCLSHQPPTASSPHPSSLPLGCLLGMCPLCGPLTPQGCFCCFSPPRCQQLAPHLRIPASQRDPRLSQARHGCYGTILRARPHTDENSGVGQQQGNSPTWLTFQEWVPPAFPEKLRPIIGTNVVHLQCLPETVEQITQ